MPKMPIQMEVNGVTYDLLVEPDRSLVDALRDDLGLTGTKRACNEGECASCAVHLDGKVVNSCLVLAVEAAGHEVATIEGLARNGKLDPVQEAFAENFASQCGYCTPGMIMTAKALLAENPKPTEEEVRQARYGAFVQDETALADGVVRYAGEGVAAAIAIDEATALRAIRAIDVEYEELPAVFDPEEAMAEGAPRIHDGSERNIAAHNRVIGGDVDSGFAEPDQAFEDRFV